MSTHNQEARLGLELATIARPGATIAVAAAGNIPYWSGLRSVDLLGKADRQVARRPPQDAPFVPGHNKWDYGYSVCELRPDVITQLWKPSAADTRTILQCGYRRVLGNTFVREGQTGFPVDRLRALPDLNP